MQVNVAVELPITAPGASTFAFSTSQSACPLTLQSTSPQPCKNSVCMCVLLCVVYCACVSVCVVCGVCVCVCRVRGMPLFRSLCVDLTDNYCFPIH